MAGKEGNKQELRLTFEFIDQSDTSKSQKNELIWIDEPGVIALIQAMALDPAFELMTSKFTQMSTMKAIAHNPNLEDFLSKL